MCCCDWWLNKRDTCCVVVGIVSTTSSFIKCDCVSISCFVRFLVPFSASCVIYNC